MAWLNFLIIVVIVGAALGCTLWRVVPVGTLIAGEYFTIKIALALCGSVGTALHVSDKPTTNQAAAFAVVLVLLSVGSVLLARLVDGATHQFKIEPFDGLVCGILGVFVGLALAHALVRIVALNGGANSSVEQAILSSPLSKEIYTFEGWKTLVGSLFAWSHAPE